MYPHDGKNVEQPKKKERPNFKNTPERERKRFNHVENHRNRILAHVVTSLQFFLHVISQIIANRMANADIAFDS